MNGSLKSHSYGVPDRMRVVIKELEGYLFVRTDVVAVMDKIKANCEVAPRAKAKCKAGTGDFPV